MLPKFIIPKHWYIISYLAFCNDFTELPEHKFKKLKYLCSNKEYMTPAKIEKMLFNRGIEVYLYDGVHRAWNI